MLDSLPPSQALDLAWTPPLRTGHPARLLRVTFTVEGDRYYLACRRRRHPGFDEYALEWDVDQGGVWQQVRAVVVGSRSFARTHRGEEKGLAYTLKVLETVFAAVRDFAARMQPELLTYDPREPELDHLFRHVANRLAPPLGYVVFNTSLVREDVRHNPHVHACLPAPFRPWTHEELEGELDRLHKAEEGKQPWWHRRLRRRPAPGRRRRLLAHLPRFLLAVTLVGVPLGAILIWMAPASNIVFTASKHHAGVAYLLAFGVGSAIYFTGVWASASLHRYAALLFLDVEIRTALSGVRWLPEYPVHWEPPPETGTSAAAHTGRFEVGGLPYCLRFVQTRPGNAPEYHFTWDLDRDRLSLSERIRAAFLGLHRFGPATLRRADRLTRAAEVLKHVFSAVRRFEEVVQPSVLTFDGGDDEELTFTFQVLAARFAHDMGCRLDGLSLVREQAAGPVA